jgi:hypothetical protein
LRGWRGWGWRGSIKIRDTIQCFLPGIHLLEKEKYAEKERIKK